MFRMHEEGRNTESERMIYMQVNIKWLNLGDELINMNAVSQIIKKKVNGNWVIELFRLDGSYMTSVQYESETEATEDFNRISDALKMYA